MPDKQDRSGYIYIFYAKYPNSKGYKIGCTDNVNRRLKELNGKQSSHPVEHIKSVKVINAPSLEKFLHSKYADCNKYKEWFDFEDDQLASVLQDMDELEKISSSSKAKEKMALKRLKFILWCRHNNIFKEPIYNIILGNFNFVFKIEENVFNAVYFKHFDYSSIDIYAEIMIEKTYEEVKRGIKDDAKTLSFKYEFKSFNIVFYANDIDSAAKVAQIISNIKETEETNFSENIKYCLLIFYLKETFTLHTIKNYGVTNFNDSNNLKTTIKEAIQSKKSIQ
jgi:hypothetical protein